MHKFCYISGNKEAFLLLIFAKAGESIWPLFSALAISTPEKIRPEMGKYPKDTQKSKFSCMIRKNTIIQERSTERRMLALK